MSSAGVPHPGRENLLRYADGELSAGEAKEIRAHLSACWDCRTEMEEIQRTIAACVEYRRSVLETHLPPPNPWFDIRRGFDRINQEEDTRGFTAWLQPLRRRPWRWVPAGAMLAASVAIVFYLQNAPTVRAEDLLRKAVVAAQSNSAAPRRVQIRTRTQRIVRTINVVPAPARAQQADSPAGLESLFRAAHYNWDDPLSAKSYADWRDQLVDKHDEVISENDGYRVRTRTDSGELTEASLKLRMSDLRAIQSTLHFRNSEWIEITEILEPPEVIPDIAAAAPAPPEIPLPLATPPAPPELATPGDELKVLAALHRLGADLGDPIEVNRSGSRVVVSATGLPSKRQQEIREELRGMDRVVVQFEEPSIGAASPEIPRPQDRSSVAPPAVRLQAELEQHLGGRAAYERFADDVLRSTEAMMSRAHALRRLASRFPADTESRLNPGERQLLIRLRAEHSVALLDRVADLEARIRVVLQPGRAPEQRGAPSAESASWQEATETLFQAARRADASLVVMLGGAGAEAQSEEPPSQLLAELAHLKTLAESYGRLTTTR